jgi:flagellar biosynthesis/type III secretory pathway chaperone
MASLMENLMDLLEKENSEYEKLLELSMQKTPVIIQGDIANLEKITDEEQIIVSSVNRLDKEREKVMNDIATVLNKDVQTLKLSLLITLLAERPAEQRRLSDIRRKLKITMDQMMRVNEHNRELIQSSLEMIQYNMNVLKSMKAAPETANYTRDAFNSGTTMGSNQKRFDAKQ